ncbi:MAG TPA: DUF3187 family protein [Burkholderiales bacterium]
MRIADFRRIAWMMLALAPSGFAADPYAPFPTYNQSPLVQIYGLPDPGSAHVLAAGEREARVSVDVANHFFAEAHAAERLLLDGETHRLTVMLRYGVRGGEWGIELPYLRHSRGFLDHLIDSWHDALGLPEGERPEHPNDRLRYVYERNGSRLLDLAQAAAGIGDARIHAAWALSTGGHAAALRASLKLPTGDPDRLQGSGAADLALWLSAACGAPRCPGAWRWNGSFGVLALGRGDVLRDQQRPAALFGSFGIGWRMRAPVVLKAELRSHGALYRDSALEPLGRTSFQLILGGTWLLSRTTALDVAISEDARISTSPDVSFLLSLRAGF